MNELFAAKVQSLEPSFETLRTMRPVGDGHDWGTSKIPGVYLFSHHGEHLYVGRTDDMRRRFASHHRHSVKDSPFAFRLARIQVGHERPTYKTGVGSRKWLMEHEPFIAAYSEAKELIRTMEFRYVAEADDVRQCLLEVYCAVVLKTKHNDFANH